LSIESDPGDEGVFLALHGAQHGDEALQRLSKRRKVRRGQLTTISHR
jgi:hypothetical protein